MARSKKFNNWDNEQRFETAHNQASDVASQLSDVIADSLYNGLDTNIDAMRDRFYDLQAHADQLENQMEEMVSQADYDKLADQVETLKARLILAGLSASTTTRKPRRTAQDDCDY